MSNPPSLCVSCGTTMNDPVAPVCPRCHAANDAVRRIKEAEAAIDKARSEMSRYASVRTQVAVEAVAAGVAPAALARGLGVTRQRVNSLLKRAEEGP